MKIIYNFYSIFKNGYTEGQNIFNLKYNFDNLSKNLKILKLILFTFSKVILPFLILKLENYLIKFKLKNSEEIVKNKKIFSFDNFIKLIKKFLNFSKFLYSFANILNFFQFLSTNKFPFLINRFFNFDYVNL